MLQISIHLHSLSLINEIMLPNKRIPLIPIKGHLNFRNINYKRSILRLNEIYYKDIIIATHKCVCIQTK